jgi:hypothetical protein
LAELFGSVRSMIRDGIATDCAHTRAERVARGLVTDNQNLGQRFRRLGQADWSARHARESVGPEKSLRTDRRADTGQPGDGRRGRDAPSQLFAKTPRRADELAMHGRLLYRLSRHSVQP